MDALRMKRLIVVAAVVLMLMMVLPRGGSALEVSMSPLAECTPDCTGMGNGDQVADPQNCTNYYYCINGEPADHPNSCEGGHFDPDLHQCVPEQDCTSVCGPGATGCAITCNATTVLVANPFNCSTYYFCTPGPPELRSCSTEFPYFDGKGCTYDPSVCCPPYCNAYCDGSGFAMVPDPDDCKSFYVCDEEEGPPTDDFHFPCGEGEYFNIAFGNCMTADDGFSCTNLCDAASGTTTTTSTTTTSTTTTSSGGGGGSSNGPTDGGGTTTTTTTTTTGDCVSSFTCPAEGFFPACQTCQPEYFKCDGAGVAGVLDTCSDGNVFNPTPDYGFCILPSNCPYP